MKNQTRIGTSLLVTALGFFLTLPPASAEFNEFQQPDAGGGGNGFRAAVNEQRGGGDPLQGRQYGLETRGRFPNGAQSSAGTVVRMALSESGRQTLAAGGGEGANSVNVRQLPNGNIEITGPASAFSSTLAQHQGRSTNGQLTRIPGAGEAVRAIANAGMDSPLIVPGERVTVVVRPATDHRGINSGMGGAVSPGGNGTQLQSYEAVSARVESPTPDQPTTPRRTVEMSTREGGNPDLPNMIPNRPQASLQQGIVQPRPGGPTPGNRRLQEPAGNPPGGGRPALIQGIVNPAIAAAPAAGAEPDGNNTGRIGVGSPVTINAPAANAAPAAAAASAGPAMPAPSYSPSQRVGPVSQLPIGTFHVQPPAAGGTNATLTVRVGNAAINQMVTVTGTMNGQSRSVSAVPLVLQPAGGKPVVVVQIPANMVPTSIQTPHDNLSLTGERRLPDSFRPR